MMRTLAGLGSTRDLGRLSLAVLGFISFAAGVTAVFLSSQATGALALLAIGAVLFSVAVLGLSPKSLKFGDKEMAFNEALYAGEAMAKVADELADRNVPLERRGNLSELIIEVNEKFGGEADSLPDSTRKLALQAYVVAVHGALRRTVPREYTITELDEEADVTFIVGSRGQRSLAVDCAFGVKKDGTPMPTEVLKYFIDLSVSNGPLLVVTNRPPTSSVWEISTKDLHYSEVSLPRGLRIVQWTDPTDDSALKEAVAGMLANNPAASG